MKKEPLSMFQINNERNYYIDEDKNVWENEQHFDDFYFDHALYDGIIKDGIENWNEANQADHKLEEISGKEALAILENEYIKENKSQREIIEWQSRKITDLEIAIDDVEGEKK